LGKLASRLAPDSSGIATIEYALIASLIAVAILAAVTNLGQGVEGHWNGVAENVAR
jgi:pilus assembly protein Flp/PilA